MSDFMSFFNVVNDRSRFYNVTLHTNDWKVKLDIAGTPLADTFNNYVMRDLQNYGMDYVIENYDIDNDECKAALDKAPMILTAEYVSDVVRDQYIFVRFSRNSDNHIARDINWKDHEIAEFHEDREGFRIVHKNGDIMEGTATSRIAAW